MMAPMFHHAEKIKIRDLVSLLFIKLLERPMVIEKATINHLPTSEVGITPIPQNRSR
jgi:hypothetical protein